MKKLKYLLMFIIALCFFTIVYTSNNEYHESVCYDIVKKIPLEEGSLHQDYNIIVKRNDEYSTKKIDARTYFEYNQYICFNEIRYHNSNIISILSWTIITLIIIYLILKFNA